MERLAKGRARVGPFFHEHQVHHSRACQPHSSSISHYEATLLQWADAVLQRNPADVTECHVNAMPYVPRSSPLSGS